MSSIDYDVMAYTAELRAAARTLLEKNGGPIDSDSGAPYVMVRREDFDALEALVPKR